MNSTAGFTFENDAKRYIDGIKSALHKLLNLDSSDELVIDFDVRGYVHNHPLFGTKDIYHISNSFKKELRELFLAAAINDNNNFEKSMIFQICAHALFGNLDVLKAIMVLNEQYPEYCDQKLEKYGGMTALHFAAMKEDNLDCIKFLIEKGAKLNLKNDMGQTPLHIMGIKGNYSYFKELQNCITNEDLLLEDNDGRTVLQILEVVENLDMFSTEIQVHILSYRNKMLAKELEEKTLALQKAEDEKAMLSFSLRRVNETSYPPELEEID